MDLSAPFGALHIKDPSEVISFAAQINGNHTEFILSNFPNCINLFITQFKKIGNLYQVNIDQPENVAGITEPVYSITTVFGKENPEADAAVRYLAEKLKINKTLLVSVSLKDFKKVVVDTVIEALQGYNTENNIFYKK